MRMPTRAIWTSKESAARVHHLIQNRTRVTMSIWPHGTESIQHLQCTTKQNNFSDTMIENLIPTTRAKFFPWFLRKGVITAKSKLSHALRITHTPDCKGIVDETLDRSVMILWSVSYIKPNVSQLQHKSVLSQTRNPWAPKIKEKIRGKDRIQEDFYIPQNIQTGSGGSIFNSSTIPVFLKKQHKAINFWDYHCKTCFCFQSFQCQCTRTVILLSLDQIHKVSQHHKLKSQAEHRALRVVENQHTQLKTAPRIGY